MVPIQPVYDEKTHRTVCKGGFKKQQHTFDLGSYVGIGKKSPQIGKIVEVYYLGKPDKRTSEIQVKISIETWKSEDETV